MPQTWKGKQWFGIKVHVEVDSKTKIIHPAAHVFDVAILPDLLHGEKRWVWGDDAYQEQTQVIRDCAWRAQSHVPNAVGKAVRNQFQSPRVAPEGSVS